MIVCTEHSRHRPIVALLVSVLGAGVLGGCSDSGGSSEPAPAPILSDQTGVQTPDPADAETPFISVDNREQALDHVLSVVGGGLYDTVLAGARPLFQLRDPDATLAGITPNSGSVDGAGRDDIRQYACAEGGELTVGGRVDDRDGDPAAADNYIEIEATGCMIGGIALDGMLVENDGTRFLQAFSMTGPGVERREISGSVVDQGSRGGSLRVSRYQETTAAGETTVTNARTDVLHTPDDATAAQSLFATASLMSPSTMGVRVFIDTPELFSASAGEPYYTSGRLSASTDDGAQLVLNASDGNPESFQLVVTAEGSITAFLLGWSDERRLPCAIDEAGDCQ